MKHLLLLLLFFLCLLSCHTRKHSSEDDYYRKVAKVVREVKKNSAAKQLSSTDFTQLEGILRTLPPDEQPDDSLVKKVQEVFGLYWYVSFYLNQLAPSLQLLDSLAAEPTPFLKAHVQPELITIRADFSIRLGQSEKAIALANEYRQLPKIKEPWRMVRCNVMVASVYNAVNQLPQAIEMLEESVALYRKGIYLDNMGSSLSWLGVFYQLVGRYEEASQASLDAIRFYETHPEDNNTVIAYGQQANLYYELGLLDKALDMNTKAIEVAKRNYNYNLGDIYRFRGNIFEKLGQLDSLYYCVRRSIEIDEKLGGNCWMGRLKQVEVYLNNPDSIAKANEVLAQLYADSAKMPNYYKMQLASSRGMALLKSHQPKQAIVELERAVTMIKQAKIVDYELGTRVHLMDAYLEAGENDRLGKEFKRYQYLADSLNSAETKRMVSGAYIGFETQRKEQENQLLAAEVELKNSKLRSYAFIGTTLLILALCVGGWFWMRQRSLRLKLQLKEQEKLLASHQLHEQEERLQQIIASRQELNRNNEELLRQLAEVQAAQEKTCNLDRVMERLQPRLITSDEEEQFCKAFNALYPLALHRLRTAHPRITHSEELLCMLILLKQTNEEISRTLGISRSSVLQNRYRLKLKLNLPEGMELDSEIIRITNA